MVGKDDTIPVREIGAIQISSERFGTQYSVKSSLLFLYENNYN